MKAPLADRGKRKKTLPTTIALITYEDQHLRVNVRSFNVIRAQPSRGETYIGGVTRDDRGHVSSSELELTHSECLHLTHKVDGVRVLDRNVLLLLLLGRLSKVLGRIGLLNRALVFDTLSLFRGEEARCFVRVFKFLGGARDTTRKICARLALMVIRDRCEKVCRCLTWRTLKSDINKVLTSFAGGSKIDATTFIQQNSLVE